ncbi:NAD-dependent epimerase/dehydratase family protein [Proteus mirabilis]|uniref:NAD-dependent epimerase/dehydratase family protein n=1 Tax=Proteus mirabilis TaxID=584 RepID=UPI0007DBFF7E|nr:NAD(P)-dependent oxidoreductase [Proteus mirabilis]MCU9564832.1 NAD(P)-dependent oxidoreductase [Proteus mirabilis]MDM3695998.1 NAD(P)-dependent oxidoreductase [Proteus mirabilis]OAS31810.1 nucleoside-diphosphate sugar epimerase [Proteus mirabilis]OAS33288.1 nucleoside-diphosphate sugar epimerase [Proteus mirabilis]
MKKIIIFGATGNVGSYLTRYCSEYFDKNEYEIIAVGSRETAAFDEYGVKYINVNIKNINDFNRLPTDNIHAVMLLAAKIPSYMDEYDAREYLEVNIMGAFNVLEYCRKAKADRILYTQTVFDISLHAGENITLPPDLERKFDYKGDHAVYVISKNTALELIEHYHEEYGLKKFIFRLPTIYNYSPYHFYYPNGVKTKRPLYQMIEKAKLGEDIELWGNPNYAKDMVYVDDFSQMLCKAATVENITKGFYNVGTGIPVTLQEQIETIIDVFSPTEKKSKIIFRPEKPYGGGFLMDVSNAKNELGYSPKFSCRDLFEAYKKEMSLDRFDSLRKK